MLNKIRHLFLNFQNRKLENQYLFEKSIEIQRPVYLTLLIFGLISNTLVLFSHFFDEAIPTWFINVGGIAFQILQVIIIVIYKQWQFQQLALTLTNIIIGCLQINVDPKSTSNQEFFGYGCVFTQLQCAVYFVSNFSHASFQIMGLYIIRVTITTYFAQRPDFLSISVGLFGSILMIITIYVKDKSSRRYFIQNLKDHHHNQISSFLINKPYIKIQYHENLLHFDLLSHFLIQIFPTYDSNLCNSCNARKFLRECFVEKCQTLETSLIKHSFNAQKGVLINARNKKLKFNLRICELDPQFQQYIIIFQRIQTQCEDQLHIQKEKLKLKQFFKNNKSQIHQKIFSFGAYNILLLNSKFLAKINIIQTLQKIVKFYRKHFYQSLQIDILSKNCDFQLYTYSAQLKIFLFQIIGIIGYIHKKSKSRVYINLEGRSNKLYMSVLGINNYDYFLQVSQNYLIQVVLDLLVEEKHLFKQKQEFLLKNYSQGSFSHIQNAVE